MIGGLAWMVFVLSIGAVSLLMLVIRHSSAAQTASLLYLTPPLAALEAYLIFGEELHVLAIVGLAVAAAGVFLGAPRRPRRRAWIDPRPAGMMAAWEPSQSTI